jgi:hypothetical protein
MMVLDQIYFRYNLGQITGFGMYIVTLSDMTSKETEHCSDCFRLKNSWFALVLLFSASLLVVPVVSLWKIYLAARIVQDFPNLFHKNASLLSTSPKTVIGILRA